MSLICSFPLHLFYLLVFLYQFFSVKTKQSITRKSFNDLKSKKPHKKCKLFNFSQLNATKILRNRSKSSRTSLNHPPISCRLPARLPPLWRHRSKNQSARGKRRRSSNRKCWCGPASLIRSTSVIRSSSLRCSTPLQRSTTGGSVWVKPLLWERMSRSRAVRNCCSPPSPRGTAQAEAFEFLFWGFFFSNLHFFTCFSIF